MTKSTLLVFFLIGVQMACGQTSQDTLYALWNNTNAQDTTRLYAFEEYIYEGYNAQYPDSAVVLWNEYISFAEKIGADEAKINALITMGYGYFQIGDYPKALRAYNSAIDLAKKKNDSLSMATAMLQMGYLYHDNEDHITALKQYKSSLKIFEVFNDTFGKSAVYNELGSLYKERKDFVKSLEYYQKSIALDASGDDFQPSQYANIASLYLEMGDFEKAKSNIERSLELYQSTSDIFGIATAYAGLGDVSAELDDHVKAREYYNQSRSLYESHGNALGLSSMYVALGMLDNAEKKYRQAIVMCQKSLEIRRGLGDIGGQEEACSCLYEAYKSIGQTEKALAFLEERGILSDSIKSEITSNTLQQMEFSKKIVTDSLLQVKKDLEIDMAHQAEVRRKDKNRNIAIGVGIGFLLLSLGFFSRWRYVQKSKVIIEREKDRSESLLLNILPAEIAEELKQKGEAKARDFELVSIIFTDFKGFTEMSAKLSASDLINELNDCFKAFDFICDTYDIEKIKTIGDAYMAAGGLPIPTKNSVQNTILAGLEMQEFMDARHKEKEHDKDACTFEMRLGIHTGPVVAGIVGVKKFQYDIWGDTVNTASRMESSGAVGKVNISQYTYELIKDDPQFEFESRGKIAVKGKGEINMWFVQKRNK